MKELFNMVYNWGKFGVVTDFKCYAFVKAVELLVKSNYKNE